MTTERQKAALQAATYTARKKNRGSAYIRAIFQFAANPSNGDTITIAGTVVTFGTDVTIQGDVVDTLRYAGGFLNNSTDSNIAQGGDALYRAYANSLQVFVRSASISMTFSASAATLVSLTAEQTTTRQRLPYD